ncbi:MAG TPA: GNVR domain-containing protein [Bacteroidota bacterium]|jgi:uncharacterized protein involved in exopolysaccharide biosynthesis
MEDYRAEIEKKTAEYTPIPGSNETAKPLGESILDFVSVLVRWRKFIAVFVFGTTVLVTIVALLLPKWYKATASVFPAEQTDLFSGLQGVSSLVKSFSPVGRLSSLTGPTEAERYTAILKSENALTRVIDKFDLTKVYDITNYPHEKTMKELLSNVDLVIADEGNLEVSVYDMDPARSAAMANYFVDILNDINAQLHVQNAKGNREFVEQRFDQNQADLRKAEDALKTFQLEHGVIAMPEQTEASVKAGAELYALLAMKEIELAGMKRSLSDAHPSIAQKQIEIDAIKSKLKELSVGSGGAPDEMKILVPFRQTPELASGYVRLYREVEIQNKILQFLTPLYEQSKVEEKRSTPSVVVLDRATVPERKSKPKVSLYALLAFVISTMISLAIIFTAEGVERLRRAYPERFNTLLETAWSDKFGLFWKRGNRSR